MEDSREASATDLAAIAARLHVAAVAEVRRLEAEIAIRDGRLHWTRNEPEPAERALRRALRWCPEHAGAHRTLAEYLLRLDRLGEAIATARRAAELSPESYEYRHFLGILLRRAGDFAGAAEAQARALELNPGHAASRHELEQVLIRQADAEARRSADGHPQPNGAIAMAVTRFALTARRHRGAGSGRASPVGLRYTGGLAAGSRIERPTSIASPVPPDAFIDVGAFCSLGGASLNNARIGRYCSVASGVTIGAHEHPTDWLTTSRTAYYPEVHGWDAIVAGDAAPGIHARKRPYLTSCPTTTLGPDVWIGQGAFVKSGVSIGPGAIVGARATVLSDVPPYAVVVGTPARRRAAALPRGDGRAAAARRVVALFDLRPLRRADRRDRRGARRDRGPGRAGRGPALRGAGGGPEELADPARWRRR